MTDAKNPKTENPNEVVPPGSLPIEVKNPGQKKVPDTQYQPQPKK
jgi:hypothetical protein